MPSRFIYFAKGARGEVCLRALLKAGYQPLAVVNPADSYRSALLELCQTANVPLIEGDAPNSPQTMEQIRGYDADLFIMAGYNRILKEELLALPARGVINLHGGKLPDYRGTAPINWQIIHGETTLGCTILYADAGIDTGNIIAERTYELRPDQTAADAVTKTLAIFPDMLLEVMAKLNAEDSLEGKPQDLSAGATFGRRFPEDSEIDWPGQTAAQVHNFVRALADPYPNAFTYRTPREISDAQPRIIRIIKTSLSERTMIGKPGRVLGFDGSAALIGCKDRALRVESLRLGVEDQTIIPAREVLTIYDQLGR